MRSLVVLALALSASSLVGCGTTLRGRVDACAARPSLGCSSAFARLAAEDRDAAVDAYRRMAARMVATCERLKATALASGEPEGASLRELTNDAFVCLRVAALQLGAAGVEAGRIAMRESSLAPDAIPADWDAGVATLTFLCGPGASAGVGNDSYRMVRSTGASEEACLMLGDIEHAAGSEGSARELYGASCRHSWGADAGRVRGCVTQAPSRSESRWFVPAVRLVGARAMAASLGGDVEARRGALGRIVSLAGGGLSEPLDAVRRDAETRLSELPPAAALAATLAAPPAADESAAATAASAAAAAPVQGDHAMPPPGHACAGTWSGSRPDSGGRPMSLTLRVFRNEGVPSACGSYEQRFRDGSVSTWGLFHCSWEEGRMRTSARGMSRNEGREPQPLEDLRVQAECRASAVSLETTSVPEEGDDSPPRVRTQRLRRRR